MDDWEHFTVTFSNNYPTKSPSQFMRISGDTAKLGNWNKGTGPIDMQTGAEVTWLTGEKVRPWVFN